MRAEIRYNAQRHKPCVYEYLIRVAKFAKEN